METLTGALLAAWIASCILIAIFLSVLALAGLICFIVPPDVRVDRFEAFSGFVCCGFIAGLFYIHVYCLMTKPQETPEPPKTRDILLTVPEKSSVNAQVTSENDTVNITGL